MEQRDRMATLDAFRRGEIALLAASDVAARGLDIPDVSHIFNFDVPVTPEDYVHRIGRTGRAGKEGYAATLVTPRDIEAVRAIEKLCREKIEWLGGEPSQEDLDESRTAGEGDRRPRRGRGGKAAGGRRGEMREGRRRSADDSAQRGEDSERKPRPNGRAHRPHADAAEDKKPANADQPAPRRAQRPPRQKEPEVVGMGDHVPAFLLTPIRRAR
jgi:superfamily II DNA/RNA helicase